MLTGESIHQPGWYIWGLGYGYDANGSLSTQTYPTGLTISYAPNALGQATQARDQYDYTYASGASYYPNGALKQFTYGNGIVHSMSQNARQLPQDVVSSGGVLHERYTYDQNGNVASILDVQDGGHLAWALRNRWMQYDGLDRLIAVGSGSFGGDHWHRFTYDALDNLTSWKLGGVKDHTYVYDAQNRLGNLKNPDGATVVGFGYDPQGNLANKNGRPYTFDYGNRLREAYGPSGAAGGPEWYRYDAHGRRVNAWGSALNLIATQYAQSGQLLYTEDYRAGKNLEHIYLAGSLVADRIWTHATSSYSATFQHTDALGSPIAVTNQAGQVIERNNYEPYGAVIGKPNYQGIGYTGHVQDAATGLTYMQQRYYDPLIGRFLSVDPVTAYEEPIAGFNRYWYASNNPYRFTDPDGRRIVFAPGTSAAFKKQFGQVIQYHNKHGTSGVFSRLEKRSEVVTVQEASAQHDFSFDPATDTITMDLTSGLEVAPGQVQTPALGALHEAGHAEAHLNNPKAEQADFQTPDANYGNKAEKAVIDKVETPAAQKIGEPTRTNHGGTPVQVKCPTCDK